MIKYPENLQKLIDSFKKFPSIQAIKKETAAAIISIKIITSLNWSKKR